MRFYTPVTSFLTKLFTIALTGGLYPSDKKRSNGHSFTETNRVANMMFMWSEL